MDTVLRGAILLALFGILTGPALAADRPPNVLLIVTDDQRPDTIHALGNDAIRTPNLDRLVREGTAFTRAVSPNPLCVPSRAEILTGCSGFRNGVLPGFRNDPAPGLVTWPEAMRKAGYRAYHVGKWDVAGRPVTRGYDASLGLLAGGAPIQRGKLDARGRETTGYPGWVFQDDAGRMFPGRGVGLAPDTDVQLADAAIELLNRPGDGPVFLHVNFTGPHDPLLRPPGVEPYDPARMPLQANFLPAPPFEFGNRGGRDEMLYPPPRTAEGIREELALYYGVITHVDAQIGRIRAALEATGRAANTLILFTSDNGLAIGSHGLVGKSNMYEHSVGVPLIVAGPGVAAGRRCASPVYLRDLYPTACDLAGAPFPSGLDGRSRATVARGGEGDPDEPVFGYYMDYQRMVRVGGWKLIRYPKLGRDQLFDLSRDPDELTDLSADPGSAAALAKLDGTLKAWQARVGDPLLTAAAR